jgi:hypothetical protein
MSELRDMLQEAEFRNPAHNLYGVARRRIEALEAVLESARACLRLCHDRSWESERARPEEFWAGISAEIMAIGFVLDDPETVA